MSLHDVNRNLLNIIFLAINNFLVKKNPNILALKSNYFLISLYKALCLKEVNLA